MSRLLKNGLLLCLTVSSAAFVGCSDDNDGLAPNADAGAHSDAGAPHDASVGSLDSGSPSIDSGLSDAGTTAADASQGAATTTLHATLTAAQETTTPACMAGPNATGSATVTISADQSTLQVELTYSGLSGSGTAAAGHIHYGATGVAGGVVLPFSGNLASPISQTLTATNYVAVSGAPATFAAFLTDLKAGKAYINLHTAACSDGEIRGQIQ